MNWLEPSPKFQNSGLLSGLTGYQRSYLNYGSEGFATPYYEPPTGGVPNNQVRHAVGGMLAGYNGRLLR